MHPKSLKHAEKEQGDIMKGADGVGQVKARIEKKLTIP
jgi:hypothetical protein